MAKVFTTPADTHITGAGRPAADINAVVDMLIALGSLYSVLNSANSGGADDSRGNRCHSSPECSLSGGGGHPAARNVPAELLRTA